MGINFGVVLEDVLKDALVGGALACEIFVKNPTHQTQAAAMLTAANTLVQTIIGQINAPARPAAAPAVTTASAQPASVLPQ